MTRASDSTYILNFTIKCSQNSECDGVNDDVFQ